MGELADVCAFEALDVCYWPPYSQPRVNLKVTDGGAWAWASKCCDGPVDRVLDLSVVVPPNWREMSIQKIARGWVRPAVADAMGWD